MPIAGLTSRDASFPCLGKIRKGAPKPSGNKPGSDLDHFRLDTERSYIANIFKRHYGDKPTELRVWLPYETPDECFPTWMESWKASGLTQRCSGEFRVLTFNDRGTYDKTDKLYDKTEKPCLKQSETPCDCKPVGRLFVMVDEIFKAGFVGYFVVETHSKHDIIALSSNLEAAYSINHKLIGVPFKLHRSPRKVSCPKPDGSRSMTTKHLLSIEPSAEWVQKHLTDLYREQMGVAAIAGASKAVYEFAEPDDEPEEEPPKPSDAAARFRDICSWTKHGSKQIKAMTVGMFGSDRDWEANPMTLVEGDRLRNDMFLDWAAGQGLDREVAGKLLAEALELEGDLEIWKFFSSLCEQQKTPEPAAL